MSDELDDAQVDAPVEAPGASPEAPAEHATRPAADPVPGSGNDRTDQSDTTGSIDEGTDAFGDGPAPGLEHDARIALVTLMTQRFITRAKHPAAWDALLAFEDEIRERLDDLFLTLEIDRTYEVAFKRQVAGDGIPVLLRRDRALSRDASLLLIHLRQEHAYHDALDDALAISRDQVADFLNRFSPAGAHDQVQLDRRVDAAVRALELYHLLEAAADAEDMLMVSPAVVPLVTPEVLAHLRDAYRDAVGEEHSDSLVEVRGAPAPSLETTAEEPQSAPTDAASPETEEPTDV